MIKRFEKKKITKKDDELPNHTEDGNGVAGEELTPREGKEHKEPLYHYIACELNNEMSPEPNPSACQSRKRSAVKNGEFTWYFKFLIMIL
jgi:hypothetical protein